MTDTRITVDANLVVERDGRQFRVRSEDDRIIVDAPSLTALGDLRDVISSPGSIPAIDTQLPFDRSRLGADLTKAELSVDVRVRKATVARIGDGVDGDFVGRWLVGTDAAIDARGLARAAVRAVV